ncbi:MAG: hypothetical protein Tsb0020_14260 [Haliangiales bacterium]
MHKLLISWILASLSSVPLVAYGGPTPTATVTAEVISARAQWNTRRDRITTTLTLQTDRGEELQVQQPGGSVGDIGMLQVPAPPILRAGDRVEATLVRPQAAAADSDSEWPWQLAAVARLDRSHSLSAGQHRSGPVAEFVRTTTKMGRALYWSSRCVYLTYDSAGTSHLPGEQEFDVMDQVLEHWQSSVASCSDVEFIFEEPRALEVGYDGVNLIKIRDERWCRPATADDPEVCHSTQAAGITTLTFIDNDQRNDYGRILDADVELNAAVQFAISVDGQSEGPDDRCLSDLANTLTHEIGHLLGLDHTCRFPGDPVNIDDRGQAVPFCSSVSDQELLDATMHPSQECGETKKATLSDDDINAMCAIYPLASGDERSCEAVNIGGDRGGCEVAASRPATPTPSQPWWPLALLGLGLGLALRRRSSS